MQASLKLLWSAPPSQIRLVLNWLARMREWLAQRREQRELNPPALQLRVLVRLADWAWLGT
jgi:hypothetical protein